MKAIYILVFSLAVFSLTTSCATRVAPRTNVTVVKVVPKKHRVVKVRGRKYYYWNGRHYRKTKRGYVFVRI